MKTIRLLTTFLIITLCIGVISCSNDDDNEKNNIQNSGIVGTWEGDDYDYVVTFKADGSFKSYDNGELVINGEYSINGDEIVFEADGENVYFTILSQEKDTLILKDESGYRLILHRITSSDEGDTPTIDGNEESASIIGTWVYEENNYICKISFDRDGTFILTEKDYYNDRWYVDTSIGEYTYQNDQIRIYYYDEEDSEYTIEVYSLSSTKLTIIDDNEKMTFQKE